MHKNKKSLKVFFLADWDAPLPEWMRKKQEWAICINSNIKHHFDLILGAGRGWWCFFFLFPVCCF